ncbi:hypothetical protein [Streptomyces sp. TLI_171]|uniref:hypothetical protein n=1 Tax=Streptomyces sp. TLI_171 TaxID=1938859 RepID=UPI000C181047|nr:hypothetical protein [Streptomyces sp. TLI_171]RKE22423.1 hypothetical protein BX266_5867 [Streptomyces sp. TLI_171]
MAVLREWGGWRVRAHGCVWAPVAVGLGLGAVLTGSGVADDRWHWCLTQDHEPVPGRFLPLLASLGLAVVVQVLLGRLLARLPGSAWWLWPALALVAFGLTELYVFGMGAPRALLPGEPEEAPCWEMPNYPFG